MKCGYTYILTNEREGTLYIGVTSDLEKRICEHRLGSMGGFTSKYRLNKLVYYEVFEDIASAISREKQLKKLYRVCKIQIIQKCNPEWKDLYDEI